MKLKKLISILLIGGMVFSLASCSNTEKKKNNQSTIKEQEVKNELEDKVVIYSTHGEAMLELVASEFEKETGVKVEFINLKGELADRVRAEKENPQSDVMFGGASSLFMDLKKEDAFEPFEPTWGPKLDSLFKDSENYWFGTIKTPVMMFYNKDVISTEDAPKDWADLVDEKYENQFVFRNALSSSARAMYSALLQQYEKKGALEEGWEYMKAVDRNTKQYYGSGSLMMQALGRKEAGISFAPLSNIIDNKVKNNIPLEVIDAESGSPVITDAIAVIKNAPHPEAAKAFVEFAGSEKIQSMFANEFNRMPTHPDAIANSPEWMKDITFKVMNVDWADIAAKQSQWMQKWDTEVKNTEKDPK
ncbi:extracellular solute-binding protein [Oceanirhabdus seepicola]|uniref:Extracellular solute-binding protein n=1 Tax=Oceanirhabdus seepicola TaxID=2828781 RepID=A0A9J6NYN5_9CLOT|nr:extracellular solute-binding protein [Oceanirhabdus seepicola]MCM1988741.1 extracellular solute-binding protein [Oceanirhabdus seepicola]